MKNLKYFIMALAIVPFFASCGEEETKMGKATITIANTAITVANGEFSAPINVEIEAENAEAEIASITVKAFVTGSDEAELTWTIGDGVAKVGNKYYFSADEEDLSEILAIISKIEITAVVIDGETTTGTINFTVNAWEDLSAASAFEWKRIGGANGTGLAQFGLLWTDNTSSIAIIKSNAATKLYVLDIEDWNSIQTVGQLVAAIAATEEVIDYRDISVSSPSKTYDNAVLAVNKDGLGEYHIIKINSSTVATGGVGTTVTVIGESKTKAVAGN